MKKNNPLIATCLVLLTLWAFIYVLYIGASIVIPFVVAVLLSFIIISLSSFFKDKWLNKYLSFISSLVTLWLVLYLIWVVIDTNVDAIIAGAPVYQAKLTRIASDIAQIYSIDQTIITQQFIDRINIPSLVSSTASIVTSIVKNAGMILFFTIFILLESKSFGQKLSIITGGERSQFFQIFEQIGSDMKSYFMIKTIVSISVAFISGIIMFFFGLDFFIFWAFLIFLLNYIPNVGSIIAVFFPVIFSLIQFESFYITTILLVLMIGAQVLMWNIVEPRLMGNKLNLSPLVILISLIFWGTLWWPIGMLLSVPIMVMINIVLAHIEVTRPIAILLSEKWVVKFTGMWELAGGKFSLKKMKKLLKK